MAVAVGSCHAYVYPVAASVCTQTARSVFTFIRAATAAAVAPPPSDTRHDVAAVRASLFRRRLPPRRPGRFLFCDARALARLACCYILLDKNA